MRKSKENVCSKDFFFLQILTVASRAVRRIEPTREFLGDHERLAVISLKKETKVEICRKRSKLAKITC